MREGQVKEALPSHPRAKKCHRRDAGSNDSLVCDRWTKPLEKPRGNQRKKKSLHSVKAISKSTGRGERMGQRTQKREGTQGGFSMLR